MYFRGIGRVFSSFYCLLIVVNILVLLSIKNNIKSFFSQRVRNSKPNSTEWARNNSNFFFTNNINPFTFEQWYAFSKNAIDPYFKNRIYLILMIIQLKNLSSIIVFLAKFLFIINSAKFFITILKKIKVRKTASITLSTPKKNTNIKLIIFITNRN